MLGGLVVLEWLFVRVQVTGQMTVSFLDLLVAGVLLEVQDLVWIAVHN